MRAERERLNAKIVAENLRLGAEARELTSEEELCYLILVSGGSCNVQWDGQTTLAAPGCALLLGPGSGRLQQAGSVPPELLGCRFPVAVLHDIRNTAQRDDSALFEPGKATLLYGPVQWSSCLRTVLELMRNLKKEYNTSLVLITHDLGVVAKICDKVAVVYAGEIIESGTLKDIYTDKRHPYTIGLFDSLPDIENDAATLKVIQGSVPDPSNLPEGCKFNPRCPYATEACRSGDIKPVKISDTHMVRCNRFSDTEV